MAVLLTTKKGFINAVIEPQFQIGTGSMVTVQFSEYEDVRDLRRHLKGDVLFEQHAELFPFTSFIHLEDLRNHFKRKRLWKELQENKVDFSRPAVAYYWEAWHLNEDQPDEDLIDENFYFGTASPEDACNVRWSFEDYPDVLHFYPVFTKPRNLEADRSSSIRFAHES